MNKSQVATAVAAFLIAAQAYCCAGNFAGEAKLHGNMYMSKSDLESVEARLKQTNVRTQNPLVQGIDLSRLNPLKTKIKPQKNVEIDLFTSLQDIFSVSILGIFGMVGINGLFRFYGTVKNKRRIGIKGLK